MAHNNFVLKAFSVSTTGYMLNRMENTEQCAAINNTPKRTGSKKATQSVTYVNTPAMNVSVQIGTSNNSEIDYLHINDVIYLEIENKYTVFVTG